MGNKIGICGYGYVGKGMHRFFEDTVTAIYDPFINEEGKKLAVELGYSEGQLVGRFENKESFKDLDMVIICVPTNTSEDGQHEDYSIVDESVKWLTELNKDLLILVKSAVVPVEAERIQKKYNARMVVSPEYMGEGNYFIPFWKYPDPVHMKYHDFQIFGGDKKDTSACVDVFVKKGGPHIKFHQVELKTAALCKFMENSWIGMKNNFCNEWYEIAKTNGVDYNELRELWLADSRVSPMHTAVFPKSRGFGGKCIPKDMNAIVASTRDLGGEPKLMEAVLKRNKEFVELNKE